MLGIVRRLKILRDQIRAPDPNALVGLIDFAYQHYALGDALTTEMYLAVEASDRGLAHIDLVLALDVWKPSSDIQAFITHENYLSHLDNLFPAYLCQPLLRSIRLIRDRRAFNYMMLSNAASGVAMWPTIGDHLRRRFPFPLGHRRINAFFAKHGRIPYLQVPRGYRDWVSRFIASQARDRVICTINPRQASLTSVAATTYRDAPLADWYRFMRHVRQSHPEVLFVMVGGYVEWEQRLLHLSNVYIPRRHGLELGHELAILLSSDMFMGTSSGFSTAATFSPVPYAILNVEHFFHHFAEVPVFAPRYPFGRPNQLLTWRRETTDELVAMFDKIYATVPQSAYARPDRAVASRDAPA
jgi:hypothetical protein